MILVAGLGNPGKGYASSRHNIGFIVIDELAKRLGASVKKKGFRSHYAQAPIDEKKLILLKPDTYMNRSGEALSEAAEFFKIPAKDIIAVYDEMDLSLGSIKVKVGGGSAGHKGIQSIINSLGDSDFIRVRVGIGKPVQKSEVIDHVLSQFEKEEKKLVKDAIVKAADAVIEIVLMGAESAMNKFNKKPEVTSQPRKCG
ncbi:MAG TPA: aminoacyl-tRNA hydrolase [Thermodesulfobacteriota bacterium]|nr:aminoacyl-tRNA hydrolase [Thermodesulfobacteriota bacterium]